MVRVTKPTQVALGKLEKHPLDNCCGRQSIFQIGRSLVYLKLGIQDNVKEQKDTETKLKGMGLDGKVLSESTAAEISPFD